MFLPRAIQKGLWAAKYHDLFCSAPNNPNLQLKIVILQEQKFVKSSKKRAEHLLQSHSTKLSVTVPLSTNMAS